MMTTAPRWGLDHGSTMASKCGVFGRRVTAIIAALMIAIGCQSGAIAEPQSGGVIQLAQTGADDVGSLVERLNRMERDIQALNSQIARGASAPAAGSSNFTDAELEGPAAARMAVRLNALESDLRQTTGRIEQLSFEIRQLVSRFDTLVADLDFRLRKLDGGEPLSAGQPIAATPAAPGIVTTERSVVDGMTTEQLQPVPGGSGGQVTAQPVAGGTMTNPQPGVLGTIPQEEADQASQVAASVEPPTPGQSPSAGNRNGSQPVALNAPSSVPSSQAQPTTNAQPAGMAGGLPSGSPRDQYAYAFRLLRQANYDEAEQALNAFLSANPDDPLAANAKYWLGETHYVRRQYVDAAGIFLEGYKQYPNGPKAPDTLLKLGMTLTALDKTEQACATFAKLQQDFPDASPSIQDTLKREQAKAGCP